MSSAGEPRPCSGHVQSSLVGVTVDNNQREISVKLLAKTSIILCFLKKKKLFMIYYVYPVLAKLVQ